MATRSDADGLWALTTANRHRAVELFAGLDDDAWTTPSLCAGWTVREVCAHLVPDDPDDPEAAGPGLVGILGILIRYRGRLDRWVDDEVRIAARADPGVLVAHLRERADVRLDPPFIGPVGPMVDSAIHLRDAARPLGSDVGPPPEEWRPVLDFLVSPQAARGFVPRGLLRGVRLRATDVDWSHGDGAELAGPAEAVAMVAAGRPAALPDVDGPGVALVRDRLERRRSGPASPTT